MTRHYRWLPLAALAILAACSSATTNSTAGNSAEPAPYMESGSARLVVSNRSTLDMDVYMLRQGQRFRVGLAPAGETTQIELTRSLLAGAGTVQFLASAIRGNPGQPVLTDPVQVHSGQEIDLDVPPQ